MIPHAATSQNEEFDDFDITEEDLMIIKVKEEEFMTQQLMQHSLPQNAPFTRERHAHSALGTVQNAHAANYAHESAIADDADAQWQWRDTSFLNLNAQINKLKAENERLSHSLNTLQKEHLTKSGEVSILRQKLTTVENENFHMQMSHSTQNQQSIGKINTQLTEKENEIARLKTEMQFQQQELNAAFANLRSLKRLRENAPKLHDAEASNKHALTNLPSTSHASCDGLLVEFVKESLFEALSEPLTKEQAQKMAFFDAQTIAHIQEHFGATLESEKRDEFLAFVRAIEGKIASDANESAVCCFRHALRSEVVQTQEMNTFILEKLQGNILDAERDAIFALLYEYCLFAPESFYALVIGGMSDAKFGMFVRLLVRCPFELMFDFLLLMLGSGNLGIGRFAVVIDEIVFLMVSFIKTPSLHQNSPQLVEQVSDFLAAFQ